MKKQNDYNDDDSKKRKIMVRNYPKWFERDSTLDSNPDAGEPHTWTSNTFITHHSGCTPPLPLDWRRPGVAAPAASTAADAAHNTRLAKESTALTLWTACAGTGCRSRARPAAPSAWSLYCSQISSQPCCDLALCSFSKRFCSRSGSPSASNAWLGTQNALH